MAATERLPTQHTGRHAESAACAYLQRHGLQLLAHNVRFRGGELDLVMRDGAQLVFVEVRFRKHQRFGGAAASVDIFKQRKLIHAAQLFLQQHPDLAQLPCRFDVVEACGNARSPQLHWLRGAFELG